MRKKQIAVVIVCLAVGISGFIKPVTAQDQEVAGVLFGDPVPVGNYYFILRTVLTFHTPWGGIPTNYTQLNQRVWDDLLLSYEAYRRQISVGREEVEAKIAETLQAEKITFDWKGDPFAYARWVQDTLRESVDAFEEQARHLVQLKKLYSQVLESATPVVTDEEVRQEFLDEYNTLGVELAEFETLELAQAFYERVTKDPAVWEQEADKDKGRSKEDQSFRQPGFVSLEFLMDMWKFPRAAVYDMVGMEAGRFYPPVPIYQGYGVSKILETRKADESELAGRRDAYLAQVKDKKKYQAFDRWLTDLRQKAGTRVLIEPPAGLFP